MPPSKKPITNAAGDSPRRAKLSQKVNQNQIKKPVSQVKAAAETEIVKGNENLERKASTKAPAVKERKPAAQTLEVRERKLTPQQQVHLARARRRQRNQRLVLGTIALLVIVVVAVVIQQVVAKNVAATQLANAHASATATSLAHATATQTELNVLEPETPPALTGKTITTSDGLQYIDIKVGTGTAAKEGDTISVRYVGWNEPANCQAVDVCQFDSSYYENIQSNKDPMTSVQLQLNAQSVIPGWVEGVAGIKVGGERRLIIPAALAYQDQAQTGGEQPIPANATLIFDIQLVSIDNTSTPTPTPGG